MNVVLTLYVLPGKMDIFNFVFNSWFSGHIRDRKVRVIGLNEINTGGRNFTEMIFRDHCNIDATCRWSLAKLSTSYKVFHVGLKMRAI